MPLVVTGYVLFLLLVIATLMSTTIPFGVLLFNPKVMHYNVAVIVIALTIGTLLPVFIGYIIGDHSIKSKSKLNHHFTGMLFGLLAYWLMLLLTITIPIPDKLFTELNVRIMLVNVLPSVGVAVIAAILSISHVRSRYAKHEIIEYKPFSLLLIVSIIALPLWSLIQNVITDTLSIYSFLPIVIVAIAGAISFAGLHKTKLKTYNKVIWSAISVSILFFAMFVLPQFVSAISNYLFPMPTAGTMTFLNWCGFALAIVAWGMYWFKQVKTLR